MTLYKYRPRESLLAAKLLALVITLVGTGLAALDAATPALASTVGCISGSVLASGQFMTSPAVQGYYYYKLRMQRDGNLVEYELQSDGRWHPLWQSQTSGNLGAHLAIQPGDGNLVVYSSSGRPLCAAFGLLPGQPAPSYPNDRLCVKTDGNVVLYSTSGAPVWATNTSITAAGHRPNVSYTWPTGECTSWANKMFHNWNVYGWYVDWRGDAKQWAANARSMSWTVGVRPRAGSVVVYQPYVSGAGNVGHVAWVLDVYPSLGKVLISEMNFVGWNVTDTRLVTSTDSSTNRYTGQPNIQYIYENADPL
jgi:surface antigen